MKEFYRNLFKVYLFMARALFPKDSALQREFLLIKVSALEKKMPQVFEKLGGIRLLRLCRSAKEMKELVERTQKSDWVYAIKIFHTMQSMQQDPKLADKVSLNKAAFILDKDIKEEKSKDANKQNAPRYKEIWRQYRGVVHLIEAIHTMKMNYLERTEDPIPFETFLAMTLDYLNLAAYQQGEEIKKMKEGHTKKPIVPADEFYVIEKPKLASDESANALVAKCILTDPALKKKLSKYRAPVFDYGNFEIPSDN